MDKNMPIITREIVLIWATAEMTKAWATGRGVADPNSIGNTFNTIYSIIEAKVKSQITKEE